MAFAPLTCLAGGPLWTNPEPSSPVFRRIRANSLAALPGPLWDAGSKSAHTTSLPPLLHGHYPFLRSYEGSDPDRSFDHRPWFPDSRHSNFQPFHLQSSADLCWTRPLPLRQQHYFVRTSPLLRRLVRYRRPNRVHILLHSRRRALRTGCSLSVASHPRLSPRRSYFQLLALQCQPGQGLSPCCSSALSGARGGDGSSPRS